MKATVWTRWNINKPSSDINYQTMAPQDSGKPKCIFIGNIKHLPHVGDGIIVRKGFAVTTITNIYYDLNENSVEIHVDTCDPNNEYGPCLFKNKHNLTDVENNGIKIGERK